MGSVMRSQNPRNHCLLKSLRKKRGRQRRTSQGAEGSLLGVLSPPDIVHLVVFWRCRYKLNPRDQMAMFLLRGIDYTHELCGAGDEVAPC
jgi:hypothetical protein